MSLLLLEAFLALSSVVLSVSGQTQDSNTVSGVFVYMKEDLAAYYYREYASARVLMTRDISCVCGGGGGGGGEVYARHGGQAPWI